MALQNAFTLSENLVLKTLGNMIISQQVFADNFGKHQTLVDEARSDAGLYGDRKLFYTCDCLETHPWGNDAESTRLLELDRGKAPEVQALVIDKFRQIRLSTDNFVSKMAWGNEYAFGSYISVMLQMMNNTKKMYEGCMYNLYIGRTRGQTEAQNIKINLSSVAANASTQEEANKLEAMEIAQKLADLIDELGDYSRKFNDYGVMESYAPDSIKVIWNNKYINKIRKVQLPVIYHKEGLIDKFDGKRMLSKYFTKPVTESDIGEGKVIGADGLYNPAKGTLVAAEELDYNNVHYMPGEELAKEGTYVAVVGGLEAKDVLIVDDKIICKVLVKLPEYLGGFSTSTEFFNPRSLTKTNYITWSYNTLDYLKKYPFITIERD